ncbi:MAG: primosomal protein N' [Ruminococcaceae bacterium]|nr:primosomal protein N' [Oscillospiraceae bacterium]
MIVELAQIAVSGVPYAADKPYTYLVPEELAGGVQPGVRVTVPFGMGNRSTEGFVLETFQGEMRSTYKPLRAVLDDAPLMDGEMLRLVRWMKARYFCTYYDAIKCVLPSGVWFRYRTLWSLAEGLDGETALAAVEPDSVESLLLRELAASGGREASELARCCGDETERALETLRAKSLVTAEQSAVQTIGDKHVRMVSLAVSREDAMAAVERKKSSASVRYAVVELLCAEGELASSDIYYYTGASARTLRALEKDGIIRIAEQEAYRVPNYAALREPPDFVLNEEQERAFQGLDALCAAGEAGAALLHGVTASGKTQVYIRLIRNVLDRGKTALLLVPEIALTPQMMEKFTACFGDSVAMLHSALRLTERYDQWKRIRNGEVRVVLGTRSAVFAPLNDIGIIIMDEEQEATYTSENPPRYQTRDIAQFRCAQHGALLLLGSATPTVETSYYARNGRYQVFHLYSRYNAQSLPDVRIADMRTELRAGNDGILSAPLRAELAENIERGEQSILFLNRRGNARMLLCSACGCVPDCPRCSVPLTYHSANRRLMCHYCGFSRPAPDYCPDCGAPMHPVGAGTQRVEAELQDTFPGVRVLRMDADTVGASHGHEKLLRQFSEERVPILLGTQMVAKGLDFENVTLVGVLAADLSLYVDNYRAAERTFGLLAQVVGRAGRGSRQGRAVIQTFTPENDVIRAAAAQDYEAFYKSEIRMRKLRRYPPFADLFTLSVSGVDEGQALHACVTLRDALRAEIGQNAELREAEPEVLGPAPAPVVKVNNRYRYRVFIVAKNTPEFRRLVSAFLLAFYKHKENRGLDIFADCNALG